MASFQDIHHYIIYRFNMKIKLILLLSSSLLCAVNANATSNESEKYKNSSQVWQGTSLHPAIESLKGTIQIEVFDTKISASVGKLDAETHLDKGKFTLSFKTQDRTLGEFIGNINDDGDLNGHWLQFGMSRQSNASYATPVRFVRNKNKYTGELIPLSDELTVYLKTTQISQTRYSLAVFVPEHNGGRYYDGSELIFDDKRALIVRRDSDDVEQTLTNGYFDTSSQKLSFYFPYWGGIYHFKKISDREHFLLPSSEKVSYQLPAKVAGDWLIGNAEEYGINSDALVTFSNERIVKPAQSAQETQLEALLVARGGKLVFEQYFRGFDQNDVHDLRSASKSLTGLLAGLVDYAQKNTDYPNRLPTSQTDILQSPVYKTLSYPQSTPAKNAILLEHLLNMSSGLDCDDGNRDSPGNESTMQSQNMQPNWQAYILDLLVIHPPAKHAAYCSGGISLGGGVVSAATGHWVPRIVDDLFARPLGIKHYHINLQADGKKAYNGGGMRLRARDFLKMGQLLLDDGKWQNKRLLSANFVNKVLSPTAEMHGTKYGLGWWMRDYEVAGKTYRTFYASGNGGQNVFIVPELDLAVAFLASSYNSAGGRTARNEWFPQVILKHAIE